MHLQNSTSQTGFPMERGEERISPKRRREAAFGTTVLALGVLLGLVLPPPVQADTTISITGIGTSIDAIDTHVESVTYSNPVDRVIHGIPAVEISGTVTGVGWGGSGIVPRAANAHYRYDIPFVARWRRDGARARLVFYNHGGGLSLMAAVKRDKLVGAANPNRFAELNGDLLVGVPALLDGATYVSINRRGLREDGTFSATYLAPVAPLTDAEVAVIEAELADPVSSPGDPGFVQPGLAVGAPVPVLPTNDAPTCRDVARALEQVVAGIQGRPFLTRIAVGTSSGARLFAAMDFGRSVTPTSSVRTGGNHLVPYDASSPRIFDGFILSGFTYIPGVEHADSAFPISAPAMFIQGQADERYQQHVTMAYELLQKDVVLDGRVWIYEIKNLTHVPRDVVQETTTPSDGDRLACFLSAAIRNLRRHLEEGRAPPASRMAGRVIDGVLRFEQSGGALANVVPIPSDPARDVVIFDPQLMPRPIGAAETARWQAVTVALPHMGDAITPPTVACRLGGYKLMFFGSQLVPDSPSRLRARYGSFACYRACVRRTVACLEAQGLYDPRVESACDTAEFARPLFSHTSPRLVHRAMR
jgi:hypothetical protein